MTWSFVNLHNGYYLRWRVEKRRIGMDGLIVGLNCFLLDREGCGHITLCETCCMQHRSGVCSWFVTFCRIRIDWKLELIEKHSCDKYESGPRVWKLLQAYQSLCLVCFLIRMFVSLVFRRREKILEIVVLLLQV